MAHGVQRANCINVPDFIEISQMFFEMSQLVQFSRWRLSAILNFKNRILLAAGVRRAEMHHFIKFCQNLAGSSPFGLYFGPIRKYYCAQHKGRLKIMRYLV